MYKIYFSIVTVLFYSICIHDVNMVNRCFGLTTLGTYYNIVLINEWQVTHNLIREMILLKNVITRFDCRSRFLYSLSNAVPLLGKFGQLSVRNVLCLSCLMSLICCVYTYFSVKFTDPPRVYTKPFAQY